MPGVDHPATHRAKEDLPLPPAVGRAGAILSEVLRPSHDPSSGWIRYRVKPGESSRVHPRTAAIASATS